MASELADRNLLFGVLALQMEFVNRDQVLAALNAWGHAKERTLGDLLVEQGALDAGRRQLLDAVVLQRLQQHGNDAVQSLKTLALPPALGEHLSQIADPDVQASVRHLATPAPQRVVDDFATNYPAGVQTQPEPPKPADPYATNFGVAVSATHPEPPKAADPYATNLGSVVGGATKPESRVPGPSTPAGPGMASPYASRFSVKRLLARGGLGEVHVAEDEELHREVALKQIQSHHADDVESQARFMAEAEFTGKLEHPGIVPVYGLGTYADGRPYYAMRFIRGDSLKEHIDQFHKADGANRDARQRNLELRHLLERFIDVCQAIEYAHSRGVLHRDLKPGNIMLGKYGETLVVDWGLAKTIGEDEKIPTNPDQRRVTLSGTASATPTMMGAAVGTPQFMSPEQAAGNLDKLGPASDVYSLGATLYDLLVGTVPIVDRDLINLLKRVQKGDFPKPRTIKASIPAALEAVCLKAMALKPEDRYPTPKGLADDLEAWLGDEPVSAYAEPWTAKAARFVRRRPAIVAVAVAAMVFFVVLAFVIGAAERRERFAKEEAKANYKLARDAVDHYHTNVSENVLLNEPGMQPLRKDLLKDAEEFYKKFVKKYENDPTAKGELARAKYRLALITADIASEKEGIAGLQAAADIFGVDPSTDPADLARAHHHLGRLYRVTDDFEKSEQNYQKALTIWEALRGPTDDHLAGLARSTFGMGNVLQRTRQYEKSAAHYVKALGMLDKLVEKALAEKNAKVAEHQRDLAVVHSDLGIVYTILGDKNAEAEKELTQAIAVQTQLTKRQPNISKFQNDLAASRFNLGEVRLQTRQFAAAIEEYQTAVKGFEQLTQTHPAVLDYHSRLADAYAALANALLMAGKTEPAIKASQRALEVQQQLVEVSREAGGEKEVAAKYRGSLALRHVEHGDLLRRAGDPKAAEKAYQEASKIQKQLTVDVPKTADYHADLARTRLGLGRLRLSQKEFERAEEEFTAALQIWEKLQKEYPESTEFAVDVGTALINLRAVTRASSGYRLALAPLDNVIGVFASHAKIKQPAVRNALFQSYWTRAEARTNHAMFTEALLDWEQAKNWTADATDETHLRIYRSVTLARYGQSEQAVAEATVLAPACRKFPQELTDLARVYALCATAEAKTTGDGAEAAKKRAEQYADRAGELLEQARKLAYFDRPDRRQRLLEDADWQFLRTRESFQTWLRNLAPAKSTTAQ